MATVSRRRPRDEDEEETRPRSRRGRDEEDRDDRDEEDDPPRSSRSSRRSSRDDEDEPAPRRSRRGRDDEDEEDEPPRRARRSSRDEEDEEDEPPRRSRRTSRDDEEEDEPAPRSRRRGRSDEEDEDEPPRRGRSSRSRDDEDEKPRSRRGGSRDDEDDDEGVGSGWAGSRQNRKEMYETDRLDLTKDHVLVKFQEDAPFASVHVHWVPGDNGRQRMMAGPKKKGDCPLCDANHAGSPYDFFNVVLLDEKGPPKPMYLRATPGLVKKIEAMAGARSGPLSKPYYEMWKEGGETKSDGPPRWEMTVVRERDLEEEWGVEPLDDRELDDLFEKAKTLKDVHTPASREELKAAARDFRDRE